ncbi:sodium-dependent bicarbonate transport family permease [Bacillus sp. 31A1R]|uniref:Sodium-dependent bicarbonate transport family permease n=1 Tax=Robertmurraya mangrovi TaxID=3098077 RepID=A0ABU5J356_9BACI|nr:sodium-dependent bicarbonate transport family permease [Bacillus sp. 31A1R]MDZ5473855.1 sodium-dependent bicarbonate transport family permease [Bacillus sp. 31A1R]
MLDIIVQNLFSPVVLFFVLGLLASLFKSDLKIPNGLSEGLSIYLLIAIGIKGGIELSHYSIHSILEPILGTLLLGFSIPIFTVVILRFMKLDLYNAIGLAATYGSVSIVTYGAAISFLNYQQISYEGFMNALVVILESPAIFISLLLLNVLKKNQNHIRYSSQQIGIIANTTTHKWIDKEILRESLFGKSVLLLMGSLTIGVLLGEGALPTIKPLFIDLYSSVLILFLLNMGLIAGQRLPEIKSNGMKLLLFAILAPLIFGTFGVYVGSMVGLSLGGTTLMGVLAGSASYIAAPAALKTSVPEASPSIYIGLALGITFPFNLLFGIPLYFEMAKWIN